MFRGSQGAGQTTVRAAGNGSSTAAPAGELALRWLFPATDGPATSLSVPRVVLGRGDDCGTVLPGAEVSRYHAEIVRDGPIAILRDLKSRNGSFVNGRATCEASLKLGNVVRVGEWVGVVVAVPSSDEDALRHGTIAPGLFGGPALRVALAPALSAAKSDLPIVLEGETGTGKEVVARAIHAASGRRGGFVAVNCAALPEGLAEAELFGYRRGAFTGADRPSLGHFRAAHGGTLLFDEISDLPMALQAKVLRVIEQKEVVPLGESQPIRVDTRIIAAGQGSLEAAVAAKTFRADLFARLDGVSVRLPALRERVEDVPYLFARLLHDFTAGRPPAVHPALIERLCLYPWPFNVRELVTLVRRLLVVHAHEPSLTVDHLPDRLRRHESGAGGALSSSKAGLARPLPPEPRDQAERDDLDRARLTGALRDHSGNVSRAAAAVGISRQRAYRLMLRGSKAESGNGAK